MKIMDLMLFVCADSGSIAVSKEYDLKSFSSESARHHMLIDVIPEVMPITLVPLPTLPRYSIRCCLLHLAHYGSLET